MWITHGVRTSLPETTQYTRLSMADSGEGNWRAYLPGLFNHRWLFVAWHLLMTRFWDGEWHILVLTLQMFLTLLPLRSRRPRIKKDWKAAKLTQPVSHCWPLPPESVEEFVLSLQPFTLQYGGSLTSAPVLVWVWGRKALQGKRLFRCMMPEAKWRA